MALRHDLLASGNASAEYENKPGMGKNSVSNLNMLGEWVMC